MLDLLSLIIISWISMLNILVQLVIAYFMRLLIKNALFFERASLLTRLSGCLNKIFICFFGRLSTLHLQVITSIRAVSTFNENLGSFITSRVCPCFWSGKFNRLLIDFMRMNLYFGNVFIFNC